MEYKVLRPHQGDKWYAQGDPREANEGDVAHMVAAKVLAAAGTTDGVEPDDESRVEPKQTKVANPVETGTQLVIETGAGSLSQTKAED